MISSKRLSWVEMILLVIVLVAVRTANSQIGSSRPTERPSNTPQGFPLPLRQTRFINWAKDIQVDQVWTAYPRSGTEIVSAANWAMKDGTFKLRASGYMHTWAPISVTEDEEGTQPQRFNCGRDKEYNVTAGVITFVTTTTQWMLGPNPPPRVILLKTGGFNRMGIVSQASGLFWAEPGAQMQDILQMLEDNNLGFLAAPAPGNISLGGVIAIGGHGTGCPAAGEKLESGHTYGTISNLIVKFTAVVYNESLGSYELREFERSHPDAKHFLVSLGRTFITNVTLRAGPLQNLRCQSTVEISAQELFAPLEEPNLRTVASFLNKYGRLEAILFPFTDFPWLKYWSVSPTQPPFSRRVTRPYNYPFSDNIPSSVASLVALIQVNQQFYLARTLGNVLLTATIQGLITTNSLDLWGKSKNLLLYVKPSTLRYSANGYAVLTNRANVQRVLYESYSYYNKLLLEYELNKKYPINGPLEIRVTGLDYAKDVLVRGAESPSLSAAQTDKDNLSFDTVVWYDILTLSDTPYACEFMTKVEDFFLKTFNGRYAIVRAEWSKGWAYTSTSPWANETFFDNEIQGLSNFEGFRSTMDGYDPSQVFTNKFLKRLLASDLY